jgi:hypothetical protein
MTRDRDFKQAVRARAARTGESYTTARARLLPPTDGVLHITNGDSAAATLQAGGVTEPVLPWRDVLHSGPVPAVSTAELRRVRARYLARHSGLDEKSIHDFLRERDAAVARHRGAYVLWFEADLYDQLQLSQVLAILADRRVDPSRITLVCIGEYPGIGHFGGLGELSADQLTGLRDAGTSLSADAIELARRAWNALRAPQPTGYTEIARIVSGELRFLPEAFDRLGQEFPSTRDGLSLTERRLLASLSDADLTAGEAFVRAAAREARPFLGDTTAFQLLAELAIGVRPLVSINRGSAGTPARHWQVGLTDDGRRVLEGQADRLAFVGLDRWIGGTHLTGRSHWRWDEGKETLVPAVR